MVHYHPSLIASPQPPPTCPKCGSHRTQIVGLSDDGQTIVVRCNACGARSEIVRPLEERADSDGQGDAVLLEAREFEYT